MSSSSYSTAPDTAEDESGMRHRGHHHNNNNNNQLDFKVGADSSNKTRSSRKSFTNGSSSSPAAASSSSTSSSNLNNNNTTNNHHPVTEEEFQKPLLAHDYSQDDESTNRGVDSNNNNNTEANNKQDDGLLKTISVLARKVRCKVLDKLPQSFAQKFAVPPPSDQRLASIRKFLEQHCHPVASANAEEQGLTPRQKHHYDMIKSLWERLNSRAPRCVRRRVGEEDEDIDPNKLTGKIWGSFGFQGKDPATDFRGAGNLALEHFLYFVTKHPRTLEAIASTPPDHAPITANYPFAVASINVSMLLLDMMKAVVYAPPAAAAASSSNGNSTAAQPSSPSSPGAGGLTTGAFHIGHYSAMEARRKFCNFITDTSSNWQPPQPASSSVTHMPWTHKHFKTQLDSAMDDLFGPAVGEAQHKAQEEARRSIMSAEDRESEMIAERVAAVYVASLCLLHDQWLQSKRNVMYFNEVFKATAAKLELLFRDSTTFAEVMNAVWKEY
jgi:hypothetical protein